MTRRARKSSRLTDQNEPLKAKPIWETYICLFYFVFTLLGSCYVGISPHAQHNYNSGANMAREIQMTICSTDLIEQVRPASPTPLFDRMKHHPSHGRQRGWGKHNFLTQKPIFRNHVSYKMQERDMETFSYCYIMLWPLMCMGQPGPDNHIS